MIRTIRHNGILKTLLVLLTRTPVMLILNPLVLLGNLAEFAMDKVEPHLPALERAPK